MGSFWARLGTISNEIPDCFGAFFDLSTGSMILFIGLGFAGTLIAMSYSNLYKTVTATAVVIASNINKVVSILLAYFCFGKPLTASQIIGLAICIGGGIYYSIASRKAKTPSKNDKVAVAEKSNA